MEYTTNLTPELQELLEKAKTAKPAAKAELAEKELSLEELEGVAGGVPDTFNFAGGTLTRAELMVSIEAIRKAYDGDIAASVLQSILLDTLDSGTAAKYTRAYLVYGAENMWPYLEDLESGKISPWSTV